MPEIVLPEVELNIYSPKDPTEITVVENYVCTKESSPNFVRHITFDVSGTELEGRVRIGQSIGILPPGENEKGRPHKLRLYSVSSPTKGEAGKSNLVSTTVKRTIEELDGKLYTGICSNYLADLKPGDKVKATGPSGKRFLLPENPENYNYVFFATGTGIAPFRGMIMEMLEAGMQNQIALVFGAAYRTDLIYPDYFMETEKENDNFHYIAKISREDRRPDGSKYYVQTAIEDEEKILDPILSQENTLIYICGIKGMEAGIYKMLAKKGFKDYLVLKGDYADMDPADWDWDEMKRNVKPGDRTFEEVY
ncbi:FAD-binding oxidoreductase [Gracilimonas sp.]|uniref:FAD-binding oxidoreductase n=1 Tax=Gracilimonas sp. TaxID=1974203 RepID=UPI003D119AC9